jgi:hypothetical protein
MRIAHVIIRRSSPIPERGTLEADFDKHRAMLSANRSFQLIDRKDEDVEITRSRLSFADASKDIVSLIERK